MSRVEGMKRLSLREKEREKELVFFSQVEATFFDSNVAVAHLEEEEGIDRFSSTSRNQQERLLGPLRSNLYSSPLTSSPKH